MKRGEYKVIDGLFVRKEAHPVLRTRDGYAKTCYSIYEDAEQMMLYKPMGRCLTLAEVHEETKALIEEVRA